MRNTPYAGEGLRRAQRGAVHAVCGHFATSMAPALVAMPTGSGKTAVMTILAFELEAARVLVVAPSKVLREQLADEFRSLKVIRDREVFPPDRPLPKVAVLEHKADAQVWASLGDHDVVVGTINAVSPVLADVAAPPAGTFDLIIIDEGHHTAAPSYRALLDAFPDVPVVLFTATPFRRDRQHLPAELVFNYGLSQALAEGVLAPIDFVPIDVASQATPAQQDIALVEAARGLLATVEHTAAGTCVIARTSTIAHAEQLVERYREAGLEMGFISAGTSASEARAVLDRLRAGELAGLISVGVLGEGFDFPRLKIGVYHRRHASLPATLQFLGRIARVLPGGPRACLVAVREEVNDETRELYASDVAWAELVPALADAAVAAEGRRRSYVLNFDTTLSQPLSLSALRPSKNVQVFQLPEDSALDLRTPVAGIARGIVTDWGIDDEGRLAVFITQHLDRPDWIASDALDGIRPELHVVVLDKEKRLAFVYGTTDHTIGCLLRALGEERPLLVNPAWLDRVMAARTLYGYHAIGMRSTRGAGGRLAGYRQVSGTDVGRAVLPSEARSYGATHVNASVPGDIDEPGGARRSSLGIAYARGKVFSPTRLDLLAFRTWCDELADVMTASSIAAPAGLPGLDLPSPRLLEAFPAHPYLVTVDPLLLGQGIRVGDARTGAWYEIERLELLVDSHSAWALQLVGNIDGQPWWHGVLTTDGAVHSNDSNILVDVGAGEPVSPLAGVLQRTATSVFFADGASTIGGQVYRRRVDGYPDLQPQVVRSLGFDHVDIRAEAKNPRRGKITIKEYIVAWLARDPDVEFVIDDDRAGETADLVVIHRPDSRGIRRIWLYHLKFSSKPKPGRRLGDLYEVFGQAGRSARWLHAAQLARRLLDRLRTGSKVAHGDPDQVQQLLADMVAGCVAVDWGIAVVQPGLVAAAVNAKATIKVMVTELRELALQVDADFVVIGHE
ncbi:DEAD/DEAH box helicase [Kutzneria sp. 744]|uniref:DEAD/DEAH box helicase n=1 Tax=Kutzneria sp. (strain 744) TaxID=345341 RepID=UPI0021017782|nr:DEAD/DEAH box helicase family protein [Kutzneria sp. 744]